MTAKEFRRLGQSLFGSECGWQSRCAEALKVDRATVTRYLSGAPIKKSVAELLRLLSERKGAPQGKKQRRRAKDMV